jgi:hypothetical protein
MVTPYWLASHTSAHLITAAPPNTRAIIREAKTPPEVINLEAENCKVCRDLA